VTDTRRPLAQLPEEVGLAVRNLLRHKLRSFLTTLGIVFGVGAVLCMFGVGTGAREQIHREIGGLGITNIYLNSVKPLEAQRITEAKASRVNRFGITFQDLDVIGDTVNQVERVLPLHEIRHKVYFGGRPVSAKARGVQPDYLSILGIDVATGRTLCDLDEERAHRVAILSQQLLDDIGYLGDPLQAVINIGQESFRVVGLVAAERFATRESKARQEDTRIASVWVPLSSSYRYFGTRATQRSSGSREHVEEEVTQAIVRVEEAEQVDVVASQLSRVLRHLHEVEDYEIVIPLALLRQKERTQRIFNIVMLLIASISLVVGGIGIVNIMLATITERTREIGIRRALGARRSDIRRQFLIETVAISLLGGLVGCLLGVGGVAAIEQWTGWLAILVPGHFFLALGISCGAGIVFGLYPASRAAAMDPIEALRHE
jgi:putative ABC transport system permease protein